MIFFAKDKKAFNRQKKEKLLEFILCFSLSLCIILFSLRLLLIINFIYYRDILKLQIVNKSPCFIYKYQKEYNTITNYLKNPNIKELKLNFFSMSANGKYHFSEVKNIFNIIFVIFFLTFNLSIYLINWCSINKLIRYLKVTALMLISTIIIFIILFSFSFDFAFNTMHKIIFNNNYWLFDPNKDPIINILPETYFLHCTEFILCFMLICSIILICIYQVKKYRT